MINFEEAVEIASRYHKGQKDLDGNPGSVNRTVSRL